VAIKDVTTEDVVRTAATLFAEQGYYGTTIDDIAEALGITKPTLYTRARSKKEVLTAVVELSMAELVEAVQGYVNEDLAPPVLLERCFRRHIAHTIDHHSHFVVSIVESRTLEKSARLVAMQKGYRRLIEKTIAACYQVGWLRSDCNVQIATRAYLALANWVDLWYQQAGTIKASELADQNWVIFTRGVSSVS
jgi:AcrR family transcriptional regulator